MSNIGQEDATQGAAKRGWKSWVAGTAAAALIGGGLVATGVGIQAASAAPLAPHVTVTQHRNPYLAGEDLTLRVGFASGYKNNVEAGKQYNLSAGIVLSSDIALVASQADEKNPFAEPTVYGPGTEVKGVGGTVAECQALGLSGGGTAKQACKVPAGKQYLIFENFSDLPAGASTEWSLTVRPNAAKFPVGSKIDATISAFTSSDESFLPAFPGATGKADGVAKTSARGEAKASVTVEAIRVNKSEPSRENKVLRGVHDQRIKYTVTIENSGEGSLAGLKVVDYLPAGLEYLGDGTHDNTKQANGNRAGDPGLEYEKAAELSAGTRLDQAQRGNWGSTGQETNVETVQLTAEQAKALNLAGAGVYTKVTWTLNNPTGGSPQDFAKAAGAAGSTSLSYLAGVPLFENTMDFGDPAATGLAQVANLDNNRGKSTRSGEPFEGTQLVNAAEAHALFTPRTGGQPIAVAGVDTESVRALDVRVNKTVNGGTEIGSFNRGNIARYSLNIETSEYVEATIEGGSSEQHLFDDLGDGLCPVFPELDKEPELYIGDPTDPLVAKAASRGDWNAELAKRGVSSDCAYPSSAAQAADTLEGATLESIVFNPVSGRFFSRMSTAPLPANGVLEVKYSAAQNASYLEKGGEGKRTSSGDSIMNTAKLLAHTTPIEATQGLKNSNGVLAGEAGLAQDSSTATLNAPLTNLTKSVLTRDAGVPTAADISAAGIDKWAATAKGGVPFVAGDKVWYRLQLRPVGGADVRNATLTDFLPVGTAFDSAGSGNIVVKPVRQKGQTALATVGTCEAPKDDQAWLKTYVSDVKVEGRALTWTLGSDKCVSGNTSRYFPINMGLDIYVQVTVTNVAAIGAVDLPDNLAKYQQENTEGNVFFLRDSAAIETAHPTGLVKGIRTNSHAGSSKVNGFNSNIDGGADGAVVQGDKVRFRIDLTAPEYDTSNYVVWDALPEGITSKDIVQPNAGDGQPGVVFWDGVAEGRTAEVGPSSFKVLDPGNAARPAGTNADAFKNRSIIVWTLSGDSFKLPKATPEQVKKPVTDPGRAGMSLEYTVVIPGVDTDRAALISHQYENTASIVSYSVDTNVAQGGKPTTVNYVVDGPIATDRPKEAIVVPGVGTHDESSVQVLGAQISKEIVSTEVKPEGAGGDPQNTGGAKKDDGIAEGELATYEYSVTIPAKTTVKNGVLADGGKLKYSDPSAEAAYVPISAKLVEPAVESLPNGSAFNDKTGELKLPATYNTGDENRTFTVQLTLRLKKPAPQAVPPVTGPAHGANIVNTASFKWVDPTQDHPPVTATATAKFVDPVPALVKWVRSSLDSARVIEYGLTASNTNNRPALYDSVVTDCVPADLIVDKDSFDTSKTISLKEKGCKVEGGKIVEGNDLPGALITWTVGRIDAGAPQTITFKAKLKEGVGAGSTVTNVAGLTGYTLPSTETNETKDRRGERRASATAPVRLPTAGIAKTVTPDRAPVGEKVDYAITATLKAHVAYYDFKLSDRLPQGVVIENPEGKPLKDVVELGFSGPWGEAAPAATINSTSQGFELTFDPADVAEANADRVITLKFPARLTNTISDAATTVQNTATLTWKMTAGGTQATPVTSTASVQLLKPVLGIAKTVDNATNITKNPGGEFTYRVTVKNTGNSAAHNAVIQDKVPSGVVVNEGSLTNGTIANRDGRGSAGVITWTLPGTIEPGGQRELSYTASLLPSSQLAELANSTNGSGAPLTNTATVQRYTSFEGDTGKEYVPQGVAASATVTPLFPKIQLDKRVTGTSGTEVVTARVGEYVDWTLTLTNVGRGSAQNLTVTDQLPPNWEIDKDSVRVGIRERGVTLSADQLKKIATLAEGTKPGQLVWSSQAIRDAIGSEKAALLLGWAGKNDVLPDSVVITYKARPTAAATDAPGVGVGNKHTNTFSAVATDATNAEGNARGAYSAAPAESNVVLGSADLEITKEGREAAFTAGAPLAAAEAPAWTVKVRNNGPDLSEGPITVTDTLDPLAEGAQVTVRYAGQAADEAAQAPAKWQCTVNDQDDAGVITFTCDHPGGLANGASAPDLQVFLAVPATQGPGEISNTATVRSQKTFDPKLPNNTGKGKIEIETAADLALTKSVSSPSANAGEDLSWTLSPVNNGPSVSTATEERPITITDTVPEGIVVKTDPSNATWVASVDNEAKAFPARAGDKITWTYQGASLGLGPAATIMLTGTVDAGWIDETKITNVAEIKPGATTDPDTKNNTGTAEVTPGNETRLGIGKDRVVQIDGVWQSAADLGEAAQKISAGDLVSYRITVENYGPADAKGVRVVDSPPTGLTYVSLAADGDRVWERTTEQAADKDDFTLTGGNLAPSSAASFVVTYRVDAQFAVPGTVVNKAQAFAENSINEPEAEASAPSDRQADLKIVKSHEGEAVAGESGQLRYTLTVTNNGPSPSSAPIRVTDALPVGFTYTADSATVSIAGGEAEAVEPTLAMQSNRQTLTWDNVTKDADLLFEKTVVVTFTVSLDAALEAHQGARNESWVDGPEDSKPANNFSFDLVDVTTRADLGLTKDVQEGPWVAGTDVSYTLTVTNDGPSEATATVTDTLPQGISLVEISGEGWDCGESGTTCVYPKLASGETKSITVVGHIDFGVAHGTELVNAAQLTWVDSRGVHTEDAEKAITVAAVADLSLAKHVIDPKTGEAIEAASAIAGTSARFSIEAQNAGPSTAVAEVRVEDTLPEGMTFLALTAEAAEFWAATPDAENPQLVVFTPTAQGFSLAPNEKAPAISYDVALASSVGNDATLENVAAVTSGTEDPNLENNEARAEIKVTRSADLAIEKSHDAASVRIGDPLDFTIKVTNNGPSDSSGVSVVDTVPVGIAVRTEVGAELDGWVIKAVDQLEDGTTAVTAHYEHPLATGETAAPLVLATEITAGAYPEVVNVAEVTPLLEAEVDPESTNNRTEDAVAVPPMVTLVTEKTAVGAFKVGEQGTYKITVENTGPTADPGPITVTDSLPAGLSFRSSPDEDVNVQNGVVTWTLAEGLAVGERTELTLVVNVEKAAYPSVTNVVTVATPSETTPDSVLTDDVTVSVKAADPLPVTGGTIAAFVVLLAVALLLLGAAAVLTVRRRRLAA